MKNKTYRNFYIFSLIGLLLVSFYPLYTGIKIIWDMATMGHTLPYFKYIIPVLPLCLSVIIGVAIMPVLMKITKKFPLLIAFVIASGVFLLCEILLENLVEVEFYVYAYGLGNANMEFSGMSVADKVLSYCCTFKEPEVVYKSLLQGVIGGLHPSFRLHFYLVTLLLLFCILSCFYGFGYMIKYNDNSKKKYLILQVVFCSVFLCVCIASCFVENSSVFESFHIYEEMHSVKSMIIERMFLLLNTLSLQIAVSVCIASVFANCKKWLSVMLPLTVTTINSGFTYIGLKILLKNMYGTSIYSSIVEAIKMSLFDELKYHTVTPVVVVNMVILFCISGVVLMLLSKNKKHINEESPDLCFDNVYDVI